MVVVWLVLTGTTRTRKNSSGRWCVQVLLRLAPIVGVSVRWCLSFSESSLPNNRAFFCRFERVNIMVHRPGLTWCELSWNTAAVPVLRLRLVDRIRDICVAFLTPEKISQQKKGFCFFCFKAGNGFSSLTELVLIICANHLCSSEYTLYAFSVLVIMFFLLSWL